MSQLRTSGAAITASASTTAIIALTCAASNQNISSRSINAPGNSARDSGGEDHRGDGETPRAGLARSRRPAGDPSVTPVAYRPRGIEPHPRPGKAHIHNSERSGTRGFRAFTGTKPLDGFVPCPCGWSGLEHYAPAFHVESYGGKKLTR